MASIERKILLTLDPSIVFLKTGIGILLFVLVWCFYCCPVIQADENERPNVILIMTDDQGYGDFGATGNKVIQTPHLDAIAKRSASISDFYVSPVCSPTRASLMTGRYNYRTRCIDTYIGRSMMEPDETTIAETLNAAGYRTGIFGKWHLGDCYPMRAHDQGFDVSVIHKGGGLSQPSEPVENNGRYTDPILFRNGVPEKASGYCTDVYFREAMQFIRNSKKNDKPFFAYIATNAPHGPFHDVPKKRYADYQTKLKELTELSTSVRPVNDKEADRLARIAAMITNVDDNVGKLVTMLTKEQLLENTLLIFIVDNGPNSMRYVGNMRGMKSHVHEGGIRSPAWFHFPKQFREGFEVKQMGAHIDIMPTILEACQVEPDSTNKMDGRSFYKLLQGKRVAWPDRNLVIQTHRGDQPVRYHHFMIRRGNWKLLHASGFGKESFEGDPKWELYDLSNDPGESKNLASEQPEILKQLVTEYDAWFDDVSSTRPDNYAPPRIVIGSDQEPHTILTRQDWRAKNWGNRGNGFWKVKVIAPMTFDFSVQLPKNVKQGSVTFKCGSWREKKVIKPDSTTVDFSQVSLSKNDYDIICEIESDGKKLGAYQIHVKSSQKRLP